MPQPFPSTIILASTAPSCTLLSLFSFILLVSLFSLHLHHHPVSPLSQQHKSLSLDALTASFLSSSNNNTISDYLHSLTLHPHLAGTQPSLSTALLVLSHFISLNLSAHLSNYTTLLSYPLHSSLSSHSNSTTTHFSLPEPHSDVVSPYHAYSPSGSVYSTAVFVNYGRDKDYNALEALGVSVKGCVAIVRRGGDMSRNAVVTKAAKNGVAAVVMYTEAEAMYKNGVERGTVMDGMGDPLTPGWASVADAERLGFDDPDVVKRFPAIPSMPVSSETAEEIMRTLEGGRVPEEWKGSLKSFVKGIGPGPTKLNFTYQGEKKLATIYNVFAVIRGSEEPDRYVLLGNHRDAWTYGAVDPNSGTATLLDIARRYSILKNSGWNPRRTIVLCSWDAEEFGMIGSTEWVEQNLATLDSKAVAYINVDCAVQGPGLFAGATPQLDDLLVEVTKKVKDPDSEYATVYENWASSNGGVYIGRLDRVDSDFAPFLHHAGVPSIDLYYGKDFPVYHTAFDSYNWMRNFGDPFFQRHMAVAGIWGLLALHLADDPIIPFNYLSYASQLKDYTSILSNLLEVSISLYPITAAIQEFEAAAKKAEDEAKKLREHETNGYDLPLKKRALNDRLMLAERGFLDTEGIQGSRWFRHLVYGPHGVGESRLSYFPSIVKAIFQSAGLPGGQAEIQHEIWRVARGIQRAAYLLNGELT
ncbi:hypothetical protein ACET3Z_016051 [Daucus carota]